MAAAGDFSRSEDGLREELFSYVESVCRLEQCFPVGSSDPAAQRARLCGPRCLAPWESKARLWNWHAWRLQTIFSRTEDGLREELSGRLEIDVSARAGRLAGQAIFLTQRKWLGRKSCLAGWNRSFNSDVLVNATSICASFSECAGKPGRLPEAAPRSGFIARTRALGAGRVQGSRGSAVETRTGLVATQTARREGADENAPCPSAIGKVRSSCPEHCPPDRGPCVARGTEGSGRGCTSEDEEKCCGGGSKSGPAGKRARRAIRAANASGIQRRSEQAVRRRKSRRATSSTSRACTH